VALLTIPTSYVKNIETLRSECPARMHDLLVEMLSAGFDEYQTYVRPGPVKHCIHSPEEITVHWLHLHTFCEEGELDSMSHTDSYAWCGTMATSADAGVLATSIMSWATLLHATELRKNAEESAIVGSWERPCQWFRDTNAWADNDAATNIDDDDSAGYVDSTGECEYRCKEDPRCNAVVFREGDGRCWKRGVLWPSDLKWNQAGYHVCIKNLEFTRQAIPM